MSKKTQIQISEKLFIDVFRLVYGLDSNSIDQDLKTLLESIKKGLNDKLESMERHKKYTNYKIAKTDKEKEESRQEYLNLAGIHNDWRY